MKRLFYGLEISCPWPQKLPKGRIISEPMRHMTLAFLGNQDEAAVKERFNELDFSPLSIGPSGYFDKILFFSNVVSWHPVILTEKEALEDIQKLLTIEEKSFTPHVTLARAPYDGDGWKEGFTPLPFIGSAIHLYESKGSLTYVPIATLPLLLPFEEIEHTADRAFKVRGKTLQDLFHNAQVALAFTYPKFCKFFHNTASIEGLNKMITAADAEYGCPVKAVSYHGDIKESSDGIFEWEMIVDI